MKKTAALIIAVILIGGYIGYNVLHKGISELPPASSQLAQVAPTSGQVAYWDFDNGPGTLLIDVTGNGNNGTYNNTSLVSGKLGKGVSLDGISGTVTVPNSGTLQSPSNAITLSAWVKYTGTTANPYGAVVHKHFSTSNPYVSYGIQNDGSGNPAAFAFYLSNGVEGNFVPTNPTTGLSSDTWYFLVGTWTSGQNMNLSVYNADGSLNQTKTSASAVSMNIGYSSSPLDIGKNESGAYFKGIVDEVRIYNRALTSTEITSLALYAGSTVVDTIAPTNPYGISSSNITQTSATISWIASTDNVGVAGYKIFRNSAQVNTVAGNVTTYTDTLLDGNTNYTYTVQAYDAANNLSNQSGAVTVRTLADVTAPIISNLVVTPVSNSSVTVSWTTNELSTTRVLYGLTTAYGSLTKRDNTKVLLHAQTITNLAPNTVYNYIVRSSDSSGNLGASTNSTFTTTGGTVITYPLTITKSGTGSGTVTSGGNINCGSVCTSSGAAGSAVTLTAAANATSTFNGWTVTPIANVSSGCTTGTSCILTLNSTTTVDASFRANPIQGDTTPPAVTAFTAPSTSSSQTISPLSITATDNTGVTGYIITESSTQPSTTTQTWSTTAPTSYTTAATGTKTLYAWARDLAGNVSASRSVTVVVSAVPPVSTRFTAGNKVVVNTTICARPTPSTSASCTSPTGGTHIVGELGTILPDAPVLADGLIWWKVDYDTNTVSPDGWSTDGFLDLYTSTKFSLSDAVQSTAILNVRGTPSATGSLLGTQASSSLGTIINAIPVFADAYWWWNVRFAAGAGSGTTGGWSIQDYLAKYTTPVTTATISANPTSVTTGQSSAITWSSTNATSCTITKAGAPWQTGLTGTAVSTGALSANTTFAISCTGVTTATSSVEVGVGTVVTGDYPWSGIIDSKRATDWRNVGVVGGIPSASWSNCTTTACNTLYGGSVSASTINAAISSAPANSVVRIPQGNFTLGGFNITKSNVVLRGAGANLTNLKISSATSGGALGLTHAINIMTGATGLGDWNTQYINQATWTGSNSVTGSYPKEATTITLSNTTGLVAGPVGIGSLIMLDQLDDTADGWPAKGDIYSCIDSAANDCSNKPSSYWNRPGRTQVQVVTVTGISGNQVTITPGLAYPNWRSDRQPGAYWNSGSPVHNTGIEDLTVDFTSTVGGVEFQNASNAWLKGTRFITTNTVRQTEVYHVLTLQSAHITIQSNYFYGPVLAYDPYNFPNSNYVYTDNESSDIVFENNICHHNVSCMIPQYASGRNVFGYNYVHDGYAGIAGIQPHSGNMMMDLFEGNNIWTFLGDITHGTHNLMTLYRNHFDGNSHNNSQTGKYAIALLSNNRFFNVIGNVIGSQSYSSYETTLSQGGASSVFNLGWKGDNSGDPVPDDPNVKRTLLRWGNWDQFTSTNDNGTNDQTGTRWVTSEVPSGIANFANPVPSTQTLPASFYLTSKPSWFGSTAFPAIGPDVSGGTAPNTASTPTGGHANKIPARVCFEGTGNDSGYSASPAVKAFNAVNCYGQ